jgi:hypothetical protein
MRRLALAVALACMLSGTASAGEIPSGDRTPPGFRGVETTGETPTSDRTTPQLSSTGEISYTDVAESESSDIVFRILLSIISVVR